MMGDEFNKTKSLLSNRIFVTFFLVILSIGFFYRFYDLGAVPSKGLFGDEAFNGNDAIRTINSNDFKVFYPKNNGREPLFIWLIALAHKVLKPSVSNLRLVPAMVGFLTIFFMPFSFIQLNKFFSKELNSKKTTYIHIAALAAMCFLAGNLWHVNFSRIAFRGILDPFFSVISILLLCISMKKGNKLLSIFAGFILGLGIYGYGSYKFLFPIVLIVMYVGIKRYKSYKPLIIILISSFISMLPLFLFIVREPEIYFSRLSQVSVFATENPGNEFLTSLMKLISMFFYEGDDNPRHNFNELPQIHVVAFGFLIATFLYLVFLAFLPKKKFKTIRIKPFFTDFIDLKTVFVVFLWFCFMIFPSALTYEGQPHSLRAIGAIAPVMMLCGIGVSLVFYIFNGLFHNQLLKHTLIITNVIIILGAQISTFANYFIKHPNSAATKNAFYLNQNKLFIDFIQKKGATKLIITEDETDISNIWSLQPLLYYINCNPEKYNISILNIDQAKNVDIESDYYILYPYKYRDDLNGSNILYY